MDAYETAEQHYELIRHRTLPHMTDPQLPGHDPVLHAIVMGLRSGASDLMSELATSWKALHSDREHEFPDTYTSELHGRCYMAFRGLRAMAEYVQELPERQEAYETAAREAALVEATAKQLLADKYGHGHLNGGLTVHFTASDGYGAMRSASPEEVVDTLLDAGLLADRAGS